MIFILCIFLFGCPIFNPPKPPMNQTTGDGGIKVTDGKKLIYSDDFSDYTVSWYQDEINLGSSSFIVEIKNAKSTSCEIAIKAIASRLSGKAAISILELREKAYEVKHWMPDVKCEKIDDSLNVSNPSGFIEKCMDMGRFEITSKTQSVWENLGKHKESVGDSAETSFRTISLNARDSLGSISNDGIITELNGAKYYKVVVTWPVGLWANEQGAGWGGVADISINLNNEHVSTPWALSGWSYRQPVTFTNNNATASLDINYTIAATIDTSTLIGDGKMQADCDDLRVSSNSSGTEYEVDRNVSSCNSASTIVEFRTNETIAASTTKQDWFIYYGNSGASAPAVNKSNVYWLDQTFGGTEFESFIYTKNGTLCAVSDGMARCSGTGTASFYSNNNVTTGMYLYYQAWAGQSTIDNVLYMLYPSTKSSHTTYLDRYNASGTLKNNYVIDHVDAVETVNWYNTLYEEKMFYNSSNTEIWNWRNGVTKAARNTTLTMNYIMMHGFYASLSFNFALDNITMWEYIYPLPTVSLGAEEFSVIASSAALCNATACTPLGVPYHNNPTAWNASGICTSGDGGDLTGRFYLNINSTTINMTPIFPWISAQTNYSNVSLYGFLVNKSDTISVNLTCTEDNLTFSSNSTSTYYTVNNTAPIQAASSITSNDSGYYNNSLLTCANGTYSDYDGDARNDSAYWSWYLNSTTNTGVHTPTFNVATNKLNISDILNCSVIVNDTGWDMKSAPMAFSPPVTIQSRIPNLNITFPTGQTMANFTCYQAYMNNTPPNGQTNLMPILNIRNNHTSAYENITIALNESLAQNFTIWAQLTSYRHLGSLNLSTTPQVIIRKLAVGQSRGIWMEGECQNVTSGTSMQFAFVWGAD